MTLRLTPEMLAAAYDFVRTMRPYRRWGLPEPDELGFRVTRHKDRYGHFNAKSPARKFHDIAVSEIAVSSWQMLVEVIAHEAIHLYQEVRGTDTKAQHNAEFKRLAKLACRYNGFDPKTF